MLQQQQKQTNNNKHPGNDHTTEPSVKQSKGVGLGNKPTIQLKLQASILPPSYVQPSKKSCEALPNST
jgi:hypothetical protein